MPRLVNHSDPPMTRQESIAVAAAARRGRGISRNEQMARFRVMEDLLGRDLAFPMLVDEFCRRFDMSAPGVERLRARVLKMWRQAEAEGHELRRLQARQRVLTLGRAAREDQDWSAALRAEALLARIDGLLQPRQIEIRLEAIAALLGRTDQENMATLKEHAGPALLSNGRPEAGRGSTDRRLREFAQ